MLYLKGENQFSFKRTAVALGNFDGIHKGHQRLIQEVLKAKAKGLQSVIFTFNPHPSFVLTHREPVDLILVQNERVKKFEQLEIDVLIEYPFTLETAKISPQVFIESILVKQLDAKYVIVGSDYRFAHERIGDVDLLKKYASIYDYHVIVVDKEAHQNQIISSSNIRSLIKAGQMEEANELLGTPFSVLGTVQHGKKLGRQFGIPTANLHPDREKLLPPNGVYASRTRVGQRVYQSVTNVGVNPTLGAEAQVVESHLYDATLDLYGKEIEVALLKYLRPEEKYKSVELLLEQMNRDLINAKKYLDEHK